MNIFLSCPECQDRPSIFNHTDLFDALGYIACDVCDHPMKTDDQTWNNCAVNVAMDEKLGRQLSHNPGLFFGDIAKRRTELLDIWREKYNLALQDWHYARRDTSPVR